MKTIYMEKNAMGKISSAFQWIRKTNQKIFIHDLHKLMFNLLSILTVAQKTLIKHMSLPREIFI